jgi:hypothetical protein
MGLGTAGRDHLVVELSRQRQVGQSVTVDVAHLLSPKAVLSATEAMIDGLHSGPRQDRPSNQVAGSHGDIVGGLTSD